MSEKGIRSKRTEQLLRTKGNYGYGSDFLLGLVNSARLLLVAASNEGLPNHGENFLTLNGPAAIVVAVTAFEAFLNDILHLCLRTRTTNQEAFEQLASRDAFIEKFRDIPKLFAGGPELVNSDVVLAQHVRNEIVHFYPRSVGTTGVPEWLEALREKDLFYRIGSPPQDLDWTANMGSFQLARWCASTVAGSARQFADALNATAAKTMVASRAESCAPYFRLLCI